MMRRVMSWKFLFYELLLPCLRRFGPARGDVLLGLVGQITSWLVPGRRRAMAAGLRRGNDAFDASWPIHTLVPRLAADAARFQARDYPLEGLDDEALFARFDVRGSHRLRASLNSDQGAILVGCHLGAHVAGLHWLYRRGFPIRLFAQRPCHVSKSLNRYFDSEGAHPQSQLFLRRDLDPVAASNRILCARDAIKDGMAVYLNGDIPWNGPNTRVGRLIGQPLRLLSIWIDLALLTGAPVFWVFCTHEPGGRFALDIEPMESFGVGEERLALDRYLRELNARIVNDPTEAVAHLLWPCYGTDAAKLDNRKPAEIRKKIHRRAIGRIK